MAKRINPCPAQCTHGSHSNQEGISAATLAAAGLTAEWTNRARECGHCHMIYSVEPEGNKVIRGYFGGNTLRTAENWVPYKRN